MAAVQYFGKPAVIAAYEDRGIDCWAVFDGKHMVNAGGDSVRLDKCLTLLCNGGTAATYTLQFYRDCDDPDTIGPKDECSGSFKFKLTESSMNTVGGVGAGGGGNIISNKLNAYLEGEVGKIIDKRLAGNDEPEEKESFSDVLMGLLKEPEKLMGVIAGIKNILQPGAVGMPAALAGTKEPVYRAGQRIETKPAGKTQAQIDAELERVGVALDRLEKCDPDIVTHLEQLATLAETKPDMYKMALTMLK